MQKAKLEASAAMVKLELDLRDAMRELHRLRTLMLSRWISTCSSRWHKLCTRPSNANHSWRTRKWRWLCGGGSRSTEELKTETTAWAFKRLKKEHIDAERETVAELRCFYVSEHLVWQEAS